MHNVVFCLPKKKNLHSGVGVDQIGERERERERDEKNINVRVLEREELEN